MRRVLMCAAMTLTAAFLAGGAAHASSVDRGAVSSDACGATLAKPGGGTWACTFVDAFGRRGLDRTKWFPQVNTRTGTPEAGACAVDHPDNIAVRRGTLRLTVRKVSTPVTCRDTTAQYTSGGVSTYRLFSQRYGRFEARIKVASTVVPGLQEAFWLWPDDRVETWWPPGEIDVAETFSQYPHIAVPFLHYPSGGAGPVPGLNTAWDCTAERGVYNTYALTWSATTLSIDVNGESCLVNTSGDAVFQKPYIMALTTGLGVGENALTAQTPIPATTYVDYVKVWR